MGSDAPASSSNPQPERDHICGRMPAADGVLLDVSLRDSSGLVAVLELIGKEFQDYGIPGEHPLSNKRIGGCMHSYAASAYANFVALHSQSALRPGPEARSNRQAFKSVRSMPDRYTWYADPDMQVPSSLLWIAPLIPVLSLACSTPSLQHGFN